MLGPPRHPRPGRRFRPRLGRQDGHPRLPLPALDRRRRQQVPRLEAAASARSTSTTPEPPRSLAHRAVEKEAVSLFARQHPLEGYRRQTFMMLDADVVACSPASVYRVLKAAGLLAGQTPTPTKKGTGFVQPLRPHEHWHVVCQLSQRRRARSFFLCSRPRRLQPIRRPLGNPRQNGGIRRANHSSNAPAKRFPVQTPRIISDNGPQFIAKDFKEFIRVCGITHVRTSPYLPPKQRQNRTLAQDPQGRLHPRADALVSWTTPGGSSPITSSITTPSACTAQSATSPPRTSSKAATRKSSPPATASWPRPAN